MAVKAYVTVGIGGWKTSKTVDLIACPHTGDFIEVGDQVVECQRVFIGREGVTVSQTIHFSSEQEAREFFA